MPVKSKSTWQWDSSDLEAWFEINGFDFCSSLKVSVFSGHDYCDSVVNCSKILELRRFITVWFWRECNCLMITGFQYLSITFNNKNVELSLVKRIERYWYTDKKKVQTTSKLLEKQEYGRRDTLLNKRLARQV